VTVGGKDAAAAVDHRTADEGDLIVSLSGDFATSPPLAPPADLLDAIARARGARVALTADDLADWDSRILLVLDAIERHARDHDVAVDRSALPAGIRRLWKLLDDAPEARETPESDDEVPFLERFGEYAIEQGVEARGILAFVGELTLSFGRMVSGRPGFRGVDLLHAVQQAGVEALPIVLLIGFVLGTILAFVSAIQLEQFGATSYVADLVGISMVRDMGALITAIVLAGRSGAAYAAALASMKLNEEIDALVTMGLRPMGFLVLPRVLALSLMLPPLSTFAILGGVVGGGMIALLMLDVSTAEYGRRTADAVNLVDLVGGLVKALVYGALVALAGCLRGMQAARSAAGVGSAATSAAVTGILWVIVASGAFAWVFWVLDL